MMDKNGRISPFIKYSGKEAGTNQKDAQMPSGDMPAVNQTACLPVYPMYYFPVHTPNMMGGFSSYATEPWLVCGANTNIDVKIVRSGDNESEREEVPEAVENVILPDKKEMEQRKEEKQKKNTQGFTDEKCDWFVWKMFSLIAENVIKLSRDKKSYEEEMDIVYGFKEKGYLYLKPKETVASVAKVLQKTDSQRYDLKPVQLERYLYKQGILEGENTCLRKRVSVKGKRSWYWCIKEEMLSRCMPEIWKTQEMLPDNNNPEKIIE